MSFHRPVPHLPFLTFLVSILISLANAAGETDTGLFHFVTRPDLKPPRWAVKVHDQASLAPEYWFLAPYKALNDESSPDGWVGPTIYEGNGELIWSGATQFGNHDVEDFRISNVRGEQLITFMHSGEKGSLILNNDFTVREKVTEVANSEGHINTHDFKFVENGEEALALITDKKNATLESSQSVGFHGNCYMVHYEGFQVHDTRNWKVKFSWSSEDHIPLEESLLDSAPVEKRCGGEGEWDYVHANSVDKTPEGNYLFSCRHTDTIYHIDGTTGKIIWRLGGKKSDFVLGKGVKFSRQHNIRLRKSEGSKMWVTMLDNAKGQDPQKPTHEMSRGLRLVLDTREMTAELDHQIEHPDGKGNYAFRRGNYQVLPNDNVFMGWSEQAVQSEHAPDGRLLMEARLEAEWLGSYRNYKFPFIGRPAAPPDVVSIANTATNHTQTVVYASWNGATDIKWWHVYATDSSGSRKKLISTTAKAGFETVVMVPSFEEYVIVQAIDDHAVFLGESKVIKTKISDDADIKIIADDIEASDSDAPKDGEKQPTATFLGGVVAFAVVGYLCLALTMLLRCRGLPTTWHLPSWSRFRGRDTRIASPSTIERGTEEEGYREPLLDASEKES